MAVAGALGAEAECEFFFFNLGKGVDLVTNVPSHLGSPSPLEQCAISPHSLNHFFLNKYLFFTSYVANT